MGRRQLTAFGNTVVADGAPPLVDFDIVLRVCQLSSSEQLRNVVVLLGGGLRGLRQEELLVSGRVRHCLPEKTGGHRGGEPIRVPQQLPSDIWHPACPAC
jgi:hypothetical protein